MSEQNETIFASGFVFKRPHANAPQFVKGSLSLKSDEAIAFIQKHTKPDGWINLDLLASKDNSKLYFKLNTYKPEKKEDTAIPPDSENINPADIPF
jgi:hypothetical protein